MKIIDRILSSLEYRIEDTFGLARLQVLLYKATQPTQSPNDLPFVIKIATVDILKSICDSDLDMSCSFLSNALEKKDTCIIALVDEKVVGYSWLSQSSTVLADDIFVLPPTNSYYVYKSFVSPEFRGKNILKHILYYFIKNKVHDHESMFCFISSTNKPSIRAFEKSGFKKSGALTFLNRKKSLNYTVSSSLKDLNIKLYKASRQKDE